QDRLALLQIGNALQQFGLAFAQTVPASGQLSTAELHFAVETQARLLQLGGCPLQALILFAQFATLVGYLGVTTAHGASLSGPVSVETALQPLSQVEQTAALAFQLLLSVGQFAARPGQISHDLGYALLVDGAILLEGGMGMASFIAQAHEPLLFLIQMAGQLSLVLFQARLALLELQLLFCERRLLRNHGGRLDTQRLFLFLQRVCTGDDAIGRQNQLKLKGPNGEQISVTKRADRRHLAIDERAVVSPEISEGQPSRPVSENTLKGLNRVSIE